MVRRAFQGVDLSDLDPFVHLDQMGEVEYGPGEPLGTPWHPHRGFETVTYMIDGQMQHQDSHGGGGMITDGDTQWMTAGSGILHIETPPEQLVVSGGLFHGFQLWVNLPAKDKWLDPRYQDLRGGEVALLTSPDGGALIRLIAGDLGEHRGPGRTHTPITLIHLTLQPGARLALPWRADFNALGYVLNGSGRFGDQRVDVGMGQLVVWSPATVAAVPVDGFNTITMAANDTQESRSPSLDVLLMGGLPIREHIAWYGPFVMNTRDEIVQAFEDYEKGRLGAIPHGGLGTEKL
jgi:redox-sensitive bicupin YhaK (pirin superfamily)